MEFRKWSLKKRAFVDNDRLILSRPMMMEEEEIDSPISGWVEL